MTELDEYNIYTNKDGRMRAYNKATHKVTSYPRVLMESILGRQLLPTEDVHHKDENPMNNDPDNLEVVDHREHDRFHAQKYFDKEMICPICQKSFTWTAHQQRQVYSDISRKIPRIHKIGPCCSRSCAGKASIITANQNKIQS